MNKVMKRVLASAGAALLSGAALAGGGSAQGEATNSGQVSARTTFRCQGGVRVQVTQMGSSARVDFAGRTRTLRLTHGAGGDSYENADFAWSTRGASSEMRNKRSGKLELRGCVAVK